ncbi:hypothetical protein FRB99_005834 [Tulasnella sp. 403]|nr:hypothetical protein FRB99_005834 [Tulasnella sp. 403]
MLARRLMGSRHVLPVLILAAIVLLVHSRLSRDDYEDVVAVVSPPSLIPNTTISQSESGKSWKMSVEWSNNVLGKLWQHKNEVSPAEVRCPPQQPIHHVADEDHDPESDDPGMGTLIHRPGQGTGKLSSELASKRVINPKGPKDPLRPTRLVKHSPGWTLLENVYMANGTLFIASDELSAFPGVRMMISHGLQAENTPENIQAREPTDDLMTLMTYKDAKARWGERVWPVDGMSFLVQDPGQFLSHYYHFVAETFMGLWRTYASLDSRITVEGETALEPPARLIFPNCEAKEWRDYSTFNQFVVHGAFPSLGIETKADWQGRAKMTESKDGEKVWRFDKLLIADRSASFRGHLTPGKTQRIVSETYEATREESSRWWWEPFRRSVLRFAGVDHNTIDLPTKWAKDWPSIAEDDVKFGEKEQQVAREASKRMPIVISYIVRNGRRRSMRKADHELLVKSLKELCDKKKWEFNVVHAEKLSKEEQIQLAARTTVMLGIHGNGLTHLVWMPSTPLSTVIEIFTPNGFARDYQWTSRALGLKHYAVWNDTYHTYPNEPKVNYPDDFQGDNIPSYGPAIAKLIEDRVEGRLL